MESYTDISPAIIIAYENLANAIVEDAANQFRDACFKEDSDRLKYLTRWFRSEYCKMLTKVNTEKLMRDIRKEVKNG